jgi:hypothetical protein
MSSDAREWDGEVIGSGAVVLLPEEPTASATARLVAGSEDGTPVAFTASRLSDFIGAHPDAVFFSPDSAPLLTAGIAEFGSVQRGAVAISAVLDAGHWIDLGLLDLLLRFSAGDSVSKPRTEEELARHFGQNVGEAVENRSPISPISSENPPLRARIDRLLNVACHLAVRAVDMVAETERPREPEYRLGGPPADVVQTFSTWLPAFFRSAIERRLKERKPLSCQAADYLRRHLAESDRSLRRRLDRAEVQPETVTTRQVPHVPERGFCGVATVLRGKMALASMPAALELNHSRVAAAKVPDLCAAAEERYRSASRELSRCPEARNAFRWDGELVARKQGHIDDRKALRDWLRTGAGRIVDRWHLPVSIPQAADGSPTKNPEHWGCWAACDRAVWAWRELSRMAEVVRFAISAQPAAPRTEIVPRLRSFGPNLEAYRSLCTPVLRPRPGHVFLAGRVQDLRLRCFAAVGLRRGHFHRGQCRLAGHFLSQENPWAEMARELYVALTPHKPRHAAEDQYSQLCDTQPLEERAWRRRAEGLFNAAVLGIPDEALGTFLECEYGVSDFGSLGAARAMNVLADEVVYELRACLEDRSSDVVWARLGRSAQDELYTRLAASHPDTFKAQVRNTLSTSAGVEGLELGADSHPAPPDATPSPAPLSGVELYLIRGQTLGGRFTPPGSLPTVIQQEVLLSADEVMLEVAHSLTAAGQPILAVAGGEFLVEAQAREVARALSIAKDAAVAGAARLLGRCGRAVHVEPCELW